MFFTASASMTRKSMLIATASTRSAIFCVHGMATKPCFSRATKTAAATTTATATVTAQQRLFCSVPSRVPAATTTTTTTAIYSSPQQFSMIKGAGSYILRQGGLAVLLGTLSSTGTAAAATALASCEGGNDNDKGGGGGEGGGVFDKLKKIVGGGNGKKDNEDDGGLDVNALFDQVARELGGRVQAAVETGVPTQLSYGFVCGFCSGYAFKKAGRVAAVIFGLGFATLQTLTYTGYVEIDHGRIKEDVEKWLDLNKDGEVDDEDASIAYKKVIEVLSYNLPAGGGFGVGFIGGLRSG